MIEPPPCAPHRSVSCRGSIAARSTRAGCVTSTTLPPASTGAPSGRPTVSGYVPTTVPAITRKVATPRASVMARASRVSPPGIPPLPLNTSTVPTRGALPERSRTVIVTLVPASAVTLGAATTRSVVPAGGAAGDAAAAEGYFIGDNLIRRHLSPLARARAIKRLMELESGSRSGNLDWSKKEALKVESAKREDGARVYSISR